MRQSARQLEEPSGLGALLREGMFLSGGAIIRNPITIGGTTAFLVALGFISANALWYQPHFHKDAFFATRAPVAAVANPASVPEAALRAPMTSKPASLETAPAAQDKAESEPEARASSASGDPVIAKVQTILKGLDLYADDVDGLAGPKTNAAIAAYQKIVGLEQTGHIDDVLLAQLGAAPSAPQNGIDPAQVASVPTLPAELPVPESRPRATKVSATTSDFVPDARIVRIQAGLRAFGNDGIELDGKVGARTRSALEEFQSLFGLPVTGEPDETVYAKMREIGLTD